jgi:ABC-type transporter Mla subunit MlaD
MPNISIDYERVNTVATALNAAVTETVPKLTSLQSAVTALLTSDGGLWLQQSSPVLSTQYTEFNTSITSAVNNITSFAQQFNNIVSQLEAMDTAISTSSSG